MTAKRSTAISSIIRRCILYLLTLWIRIFGFGEAQVRLFGMTCARLQAPSSLNRSDPVWFGPGFSVAAFLLGYLSAEPVYAANNLSPIIVLDDIWSRYSLRTIEYAADFVAERRMAHGSGFPVGVRAGRRPGGISLSLRSNVIYYIIGVPTLPLSLISRTGIRRAVLATAAVVGGSIIAFLASY